MPTDEELRAVRDQIPSAADMQRALQEQQRSQGIRIPEAALDPSRQAGPDLSQLAEKYERIRQGPAAAGKDAENRQASGMLVFVSMGMPKPSLERVVADAQRTKATLVLRSAKDLSVKQTAAAIADVMTQAKAACSWQIDPSLFKRFDVRAVPTYVLIDPARPIQVACGQNQCQEAVHAKVAGDVSMSHALSLIEQHDPEFAGVARQMAWRLAHSAPAGARQ